MTSPKIPVFIDPNCPPYTTYAFDASAVSSLFGVNRDDVTLAGADATSTLDAMTDAVEKAIQQQMAHVSQQIYVTAPGWNSTISLESDLVDETISGIRRAKLTIAGTRRERRSKKPRSLYESSDAYWPLDDCTWAWETECDGMRIALAFTLHCKELKDGPFGEYARPPLLPRPDPAHCDLEIYRYENEEKLDSSVLISDRKKVAEAMDEAAMWFRGRLVSKRPSFKDKVNTWRRPWAKNG